MKARIPHYFFVYASKFSKNSLIEAICFWGRFICNEKGSKNNYLSIEKEFTIRIKGKVYTNKTHIVQTWLLDMLYDIICLKNTGTNSINIDESLYLISLYNDYIDKKSSDNISAMNNPLLFLHGISGEQLKFQNPKIYFDNFAREKYILDEISIKDEIYKIDFHNDFLDETGFTPEEYATLLLAVWGYYNSISLFTELSNISVKFKNPLISSQNLAKIITAYSVTLDEIQTNKLKRQILYSKPIININNTFIVSNPLLLLSTFSNSLYWVMCNKYLKKKSQTFKNAFGEYFELYVKEILENCLPVESYKRICEDPKDKRADWAINLGPYTLIIEQKSSLAMLSAKQNQPDTTKVEKYIYEILGEAVCQLHTTYQSNPSPNCIKIILTYEDYFISGILSELFNLEDWDPNIKNDGSYWLMTINEFEMLLHTFQNNPDIALKIIASKKASNEMNTYITYDLRKYFEENSIFENNYLRDYGIYDHFNNIKNQIQYNN